MERQAWLEVDAWEPALTEEQTEDEGVRRCTPGFLDGACLRRRVAASFLVGLAVGLLLVAGPLYGRFRGVRFAGVAAPTSPARAAWEHADVAEIIDEAEGTKAQCKARLARFRDLDATDGPKLSANSLHDPDFPPVLRSIGEAGRCAKLDCSGVNHWKKMQDVAKNRGMPFHVFGKSGPEYHDIHQGGLGTCYFLSALATTAFNRPEVIDRMFVRRHLWDGGIFTTRWLVNGRESFIEVDSMIPAFDHTTYFVQPSPAGEWWPVILEKAFAKIYGSFFAVHGGIDQAVLLAMTGAYVHVTKHTERSQEEMWAALRWATRARHPMGTSSSERHKKYGVVGAHAYATLEAYEDPHHGRVVRVFNPWNSDSFKGRIPNTDHGDGVFLCTLEEYLDAFSWTSFAEVQDGYESSVVDLYRGESNTAGVARFTVPGGVDAASKMYVTLTFPGTRFQLWDAEGDLHCPSGHHVRSFAVRRETAAAVHAEEWCSSECRRRRFCCNDWTIGSNQHISCAQACMIRARGLGEGACRPHCARHGQSGCFEQIGGQTYGFCSSCQDLTSAPECKWGVASPRACEVGCGLDPHASAVDGGEVLNGKQTVAWFASVWNVTLPAAPGSYLVEYDAAFDDNNAIRGLHLGVYAPKSVKLALA